MRMARIDLAPGIDDADHRLALPVIGVVADLAQPRAMAERTHVGNAEPAVATEVFGLFASGHCFLVNANRRRLRTHHTRRISIYGGSGTLLFRAPKPGGMPMPTPRMLLCV